MSVANLLDASGNLRLEDTTVDTLNALSLTVASTVQASTVQINGSGGNVQLTTTPANDIQAGPGRFLLDTTSMRPGGFSWRPALASGTLNLTVGGSFSLATLPVSKAGLLYRLTGTLTFASTFATAPALSFFLDQTSASPIDAFALNSVTLAGGFANGTQSVPLDLFAYSATPPTGLFLNVTATGGQNGTLASLAWSTAAPAMLTANCSGLM